MIKEDKSCSLLTSTEPSWIGPLSYFSTAWMEWTSASVAAFQKLIGSAFGMTPTPSVTSSNLQTMPSRNSGSTYLRLATNASQELDLAALRVAFMALHQQLVFIGLQDAALLNLASFRFFPDSGTRFGIDQALAVLKQEIACIEAIIQNHRASISNV
jgi:hypothetical protein